MKEFFKQVILEFKPDKTSLEMMTTKIGESTMKAFDKSPLGKIIASGFISAIKGEHFGQTMFRTALAEFQNIVNGALDELDNMLSFSKLSNAQTRQYAFEYGFSSAQAYGFDKAMSILGLSSEEDLYYMNPQEKSQFYDAMTKYSEQYTRLYDSGFFTRLQEYQVAMEEFKLDMQLEIVEFFMNNKDAIMTTLKLLMKASEFIISALGWIVNFLGRGNTEARSSSQRAADTADIINSYSTARNTTVKIDNTFNNVAQNDQTWLANAGAMTYEQVVRALGGD